MQWQRQPCPHCNGQPTQTCTACNGTGVLGSIPGTVKLTDFEIKCPACHGTKVQQCFWCNGSGFVTSPIFGSDIPPIPPIPPISPASFSTDYDFSKTWQSKPYSSFERKDAAVPKSDVFKTVTSAPQPAATQPEPSHISDIFSLFVRICIAAYILIGVWLVFAIGFAATLVVAEVFFAFGGWLGLRVAGIIGKSDNQTVSDFGTGMAIATGLCGGTLAAYLVLTTDQGYNLVMWVTDNTLNAVSSLFISVFTISVSDVILQALVGAAKRR